MLTLTEMQRQIKLKEWELYQQEQELRSDVESRPIEYRGLADANDHVPATYPVTENRHNMELARAVAQTLGLNVPGYIRMLLRNDLVARGYEPDLEYKRYNNDYVVAYDYPARLVRERLAFYMDEVPLIKN